MVSMPESITTCEDMLISFEGSECLSYNFDIVITLDSVLNTTTGEYITEFIDETKQAVYESFVPLIENMKTSDSRFITLGKEEYDESAGRTFNLLFTFHNLISGESKTIAKSVMIKSTERLEITDQVLHIRRNKPTQIDLVKKLS